MGTPNSATMEAQEMARLAKQNGKSPRAPKLRDLSLTATERTAIGAILQAEQQLQAQYQQVQAEKAAIAADIERRLRLPMGAFQASHRINMETWTVEEVLVEPEPPARKRRAPTKA